MNDQCFIIDVKYKHSETNQLCSLYFVQANNLHHLRCLAAVSTSRIIKSSSRSLEF